MSKIIVSEINCSGDSKVKISSDTKLDATRSNSHIQLPSGPTSDRTEGNYVGDFRYNSDLKVVEYNDGQKWVRLNCRKDYERSTKTGCEFWVDAGTTDSYPQQGIYLYDLSGNGNYLTLLNGPTFDSDGGGCIQFDGSNDLAITLPIVGMNDFSYELWVKGGTTGTILYRNENMAYNENRDCGNIWAVGADGSFYFHLEYNQTDDDISVAAPAGSLNSSNFTHIVATYNYAAKRQSLYVDGILVAQQSNTAQPANVYQSNQFFAIGSRAYSNHQGSATNQAFYNGKISVIKIFSKEMQPGEVWRNYLALADRYGKPKQPAVVTNGLLLSLDSADYDSYPGSGNTWYDLSGNGNNVTLYNNPRHINGNLTFQNGGGTVPMTNLRPSSAITMEVWVATTSTSSTEVWIGAQYGSTSGNSYAIWMSNNVITSGVNTSSSFISRNTGLPVLPGKFYHHVHTYDGATERTYVNGVEVGSWSRTGSLTYDTNNTLLQIGNDWNSGYDGGASVGTNGEQPITRIYNRALSAAEVKQNYNAQRSRFGA